MFFASALARRDGEDDDEGDQLFELVAVLLAAISVAASRFSSNFSFSSSLSRARQLAALCSSAPPQVSRLACACSVAHKTR